MKNIMCAFRLAVLVVLATLAACSEPDVPAALPGNGQGGSAEAYLDLKEDLPSEGGGFLLHIRTSGQWTATVDAGWCTLLRTSGAGNATVMGNAEPNTGGTRRTAILTVQVGGNPVTLSLSQSAGGGGTEPGKPQGYAGRVEVPALVGGDMHLFVTHTTQYDGKTIPTYSYEWDCAKKHSRWVAFTFSTATPDNDLGRKGDFKEDPAIPVQYRTRDSDYKNSGYSRGHLCASSDRQYSVEANKQTFYFSNISPQIQDGFNGGIWASLEGKVQQWGRISVPEDTLYVVKGGTIAEGQVMDYIGDHVPVPKYFFMAILSLRGGSYHAIAFWLEHKAYSHSNYAQYALTVDELEKKTGIDFFCNLPDGVETSVEASFSRSDWGL